MRPHLPAPLLALLFLANGAASAADPWGDPLGYAEALLTKTCGQSDPGADALGETLGGESLGAASLIEERIFEWAGVPSGARRRFQLAGGDEVVLMRNAPNGLLRRYSVEFHQRGPDRSVNPTAMAVSGGDCRMIHGRLIRYDLEGRALEIELFGSRQTALERTELLNPPVPAGVDPGGVTVALFDSGLNYLQPAFARRLARDEGGKALGYDFWDLDDRPFDSHPAASAFFPGRHGTAVASVLIREAPDVRLLPLRYPRPDLSRLAAMVEVMAEAGAVIAALPLGSNKIADWDSFATAARKHPELLFVVSAGNNGRNIDVEPVYPAALSLDNLLVVTSSDATGNLADGSNWGPESVDLMVLGENLEVVDFAGAPARRSGSSYAVPRIAALAARLLARHPAWRGPELKAAILARAAAPPGDSPSPVRHGWIADPVAEP